jgi:nicotinamide phosphoribosyltransferase
MVAMRKFYDPDFNPILASDSYKMVHHGMKLPTEFNYSYNECRKGSSFPLVKFYGLQIFIKRFLVGKVVLQEHIDEAKEILENHFETGLEHVDIERWDYILKKHGGVLPIRIKAVPEGTVMPIGNICFDVINTDPECEWLVGHVESLLTHVWSTTTTATLSYMVKEMCRGSLEDTCDDDKIAAILQFMLHDFGYRGGSNHFTSSWNGSGHLVNFWGTDNLSAIKTARDYYNTKMVNAYSVPATEHSVMTSEGREGESRRTGKIIDKFDKGILSIVCDSYDWKNFVDNIIGKIYKQKILERDGKVVIRPDSDDYMVVIPYILKSLEKNFGTTLNKKKYKVLNSKVGMIWGDGLDIDDIANILELVKSLGFSIENICFGMGGGLIQKTNRDTMRNAFKSSAQCRDGIWHDIFKDPLDSTKKSKKGIQYLIKDEEGNYSTTNVTTLEDQLQTVFLNGELIKEYTFNEVIENSPEYIMAA